MVAGVKSTFDIVLCLVNQWLPGYDYIRLLFKLKALRV